MCTTEGKDLQLPESILNIKYGIHGDRAVGAHKPVDADHSGTDTEGRDLVFKSAIVLQRPVLDPCLTVGFLPLPSDGLRVGKLITMQWRVERLKDLKESEAVEQQHVSDVQIELVDIASYLNNILLFQLGVMIAIIVNHYQFLIYQTFFSLKYRHVYQLLFFYTRMRCYMKSMQIRKIG